MHRSEYFFVNKINNFYIYYGAPKNKSSENIIFFFKQEDAIYSIVADYERAYSDNPEERYIRIAKYIPLDDSRLDPVKDSLNYDYNALITMNYGDTKKYKDFSETSSSKNEFDYDNYTPIEYTELMRHRDGKKGYKDTFYAEVQQYEESGGTAFALLKKSGDIDRLYYAEFNTLPELRLVEGDKVDVYGTLDDLYTYETVIGGTNTVPKIIVDKILVEGIDY